ncbi:MAG: cation transporter [Elusimicrobia bacterium]|nr:cation transporter [Elusimicrobiota bacterium]
MSHDHSGHDHHDHHGHDRHGHGQHHKSNMPPRALKGSPSGGGGERNEPHHPPIESSGARPLAAAFFLTGIIFLAEVVGGWWTGSLALFSDAAHMGVDLSALGMALLAARLKCMPPDPKRTFGYERVEVLAAFINGVLLMVAVGAILKEAYDRLLYPAPVAAGPMLVIAVIGLAANLVSGLILLPHSHGNINIRAAFLHVALDALGSIGAIVAAGVMLATGWTRADPCASVLICLVVIVTAFLLVRDSTHILLEGAPPHLDLEEIREHLSSIPGVKDVHDLHLWSLTKGSESLSGHIVVDPGTAPAAVLKTGTETLKAEFGLSHVTLQVEGEHA